MLNTQVQGQNEQTIIHQAVERLVQMMWSANSERDRALAALNYERAERSAPAVTSRDLMDRIQVLEQKLEDLGNENNTLRDYMRMKDQAKLKLEDRIRTLTANLKRSQDLEKGLMLQRDKYAEMIDIGESERATLRVQNTKQAAAYADLEAELAATLNKVLTYADRVKALEEIIILGRKGLESERSK